MRFLGPILAGLVALAPAARAEAVGVSQTSPPDTALVIIGSSTMLPILEKLGA